MKNFKTVLALLALTPTLIACGVEKPVEVTSPFGHKMEVLCEAQTARMIPGQDVEEYSTTFQTVEQFRQTVAREENGNPFIIAASEGFWTGAIANACN
tara:strand:- start:862 stop:1155 length:294 start_codon:yes stop_codon:yes gene_type:complete